ncbi:DegV family protein [Litchfieldia salsa]|uniref:EDD domain protein, DegV family n=1 Tax=Litchfieldia salsa TaxID=930152 RepID=A0A1H0WWE4_9BACI|nr:DegV family protein [Litchfieldia salsa]SDP95021.1 EDD domain protein, DegV family [Litchfieldia salsa]
MKTAIVTDSTAYIPKEMRENLHIHMIPLSVIFGEEVYAEEQDISAAQFYEEMKVKTDLPTTSQPPVGKFVELFESLAKEYDHIISIHLSSGISGTYQGAVTAGTMVEGIEVHTFDTEISAIIQGFYVLEAAEMANEGKEPQEIMSRLQEMKKSSRAYFMVDDLTNLQKGGRLSGAQAFVGSLLQVKPILHFVDKVIVPFEKIRTRKKAMKRLFELFDEDASKGAPMVASIIHANRPEEAEELLAEMSEKYPHVEFMISHFGPVVGTHLGEGAMGLGWYMK